MIGRILREAVIELRRHLARTLLTASGVAVAVTAFTLVAGIAEIARRDITAELEAFGGRAGTVAVILEAGGPLGEVQSRQAGALIEERLARYRPRATAQAVEGPARTLRRDAGPLRSNDPEESPCGSLSTIDPESGEEFFVPGPCTLSVFAADEALLDVMGAKVVAGRWLRPSDGASAAIPVVLSEDMAKQVRDVDHPTVGSLIGSVLRDENLVHEPLVVVGVVRDNAVTAHLGESGLGFVPIGTLSRLAVGGANASVAAVGVTGPSAERVSEKAARDSRFVLQQAGLGRPRVIGERIDEAGELADALRVLNVVLFGVGLVTVVLGAVGVLNVSLMTVRQRVREFGLRRAVGARPRDLVAVVLCETVLVTLIGGFMGVGLALAVGAVLGAVGVEVIGELFPGGVVRPALLGLFVAMVTGVAAGLVPALRAGRQSVLDALRR